MAEDRGPEVAATAILFLVLTYGLVGLRCYVRGFMLRSFGIDDTLCVVALILFTIYCSFVLLGVEYGTGQHIADIIAVDPTHVPTAVKWWWFCELFYIASTTVIKISIAIFLMRICIDKRQRFAIYAVMSVTIIYNIFYFFVIIFQCSPVTYFWTQYLGEKGTCLSLDWITNSTYTHSAISAVADWTLGLIPVFFLWNLEMNPRTKISVGIILSLGAIGSTATLVRIPYIKQLAQADFLWSTTDVAIWSTVEPGIGICAAAMATLRPLFRTFFARSRLFGSATPLDPSKPSKSKSYPLSPRENRGAYIRSGSASGLNRDEPDLESALRGAKEIGTVTTVTGDAGDLEQENPKKKRGFFGGSHGSVKATKSGVESKSGLGDSSEEFLPVMGAVDKERLWVKMTTEVRRDETDIDERTSRGRQ